jgi:hypothetical protein
MTQKEMHSALWVAPIGSYVVAECAIGAGRVTMTFEGFKQSYLNGVLELYDSREKANYRLKLEHLHALLVDDFVA